MPLDISTTTVTTRTHRATVTLDGLKNVAIAAAKIQLGLIGDEATRAIASEATVNSDGSISIEIVEKAGDDAGTGGEDREASDDKGAADAPAAAVPGPSGLVFPQ